MTRAAGFVLIALGALLVLPQTFTVAPDQRLILAGFVAGIFGGLLLADNPRRIERTHGHDRG